MEGSVTSRRRFLILSAASVVSVALLGSCASQPSEPTTNLTTAGSVAAKAAPEQAITLLIRAASDQVARASDGGYHDSFEPTSFIVKVGTPVYLSIRNYSTSVHSFDVPELNLNLAVLPATGVGGGQVKPYTTSATFTPMRTGTYQWTCLQPCDGDNGNWAMDGGDGLTWGRVGFMAGTITVV